MIEEGIQACEEILALQKFYLLQLTEFKEKWGSFEKLKITNTFHYLKVREKELTNDEQKYVREVNRACVDGIIWLFDKETERLSTNIALLETAVKHKGK